MNHSQRLFDKRYTTMPWENVDTVVFDIGNVLMCFNPTYVLRALFEDAHKRETLMEKVFRSPHWLSLDRGTLSYEDAPRVMAGDDKALQADVAYLLSHWCEHKLPIEEGFEAVRACAAHGKQLCLLSNYHQEAFEYICARYEIFSCFDVRLISCFVHQLKPEEEIYRTLIGVGGLNPARSLFLDDTYENVVKAMEVGMESIWVRDPKQLHTFFTPVA